MATFQLDACDLAAAKLGADPIALIKDPALKEQAIKAQYANATTSAKVGANLEALRDLQDTGQNPSPDGGQSAARPARPKPTTEKLMREHPEIYRYKVGGIFRRGGKHVLYVGRPLWRSPRMYQVSRCGGVQPRT